MDNIRPCPFCGGEPKQWFSIEEGRNPDYACTEIYCDKCGAKIDTKYMIDFNTHKNPGTTFIEAEKDIIQKWNNRANKKEWISVTDRLPEEDQDVVVTDGDGYAVGFWRKDAQTWDNTNFGWIERDSDDIEPPIRLGKVTHWQPFEPFPGIE
jgi:Lar family restriction alleviation protein